MLITKPIKATIALISGIFLPDVSLAKILDKLTKETFSEYLGETFQLQIEPAIVIPVELMEVTPLPARSGSVPWEKESDQKLRRTPFSVVFRGPLDPALIQRMYDIQHHEMGTIKGMFLVPIGIDENGRYYESIFN